MSDTTVGIIVICLSLFIGFTFIFFILTVMRTHRLVIRTKDSNRIEGYFWVSEWKDKKDGSIWWKSVFFQRPVKIPQPPDEVVYINNRGKKWVECYKLSEDEVVYIKDGGIQKTSILVKGGKKLSEVFKPFSVVERQVIINQFAKANAMRQSSWLKENAMNLVSLSFMMIIIVMGIVYSGEIFNGISQTQNGATSMIDSAKGLLNDVSGVKDVAPAITTEGAIVQQGSETPPTS